MSQCDVVSLVVVKCDTSRGELHEQSLGTIGVLFSSPWIPPSFCSFFFVNSPLFTCSNRGRLFCLDLPQGILWECHQGQVIEGLRQKKAQRTVP